MGRANSSDRRVIDLVKTLVGLPTVKMTVEGVRVIRRITRADCLKHTGVDLEVLWSEHWGHGNNQVFLYDEPVCANCHSPYTNHGPNHPYGESTLCWGCRADDAAEDRNLTLPPGFLTNFDLRDLPAYQAAVAGGPCSAASIHFSTRRSIMSAVFGPLSSLPGSRHPVPQGMKCDDCDNPATYRMQGETDSFGCEMHDLCDSCYAKVQASIAEHAAEVSTGICEWCKQPATDLRPRRDFEEGQAGRVYDVCGACVKRENDALEAERDDYLTTTGTTETMTSSPEDVVTRRIDMNLLRVLRRIPLSDRWFWGTLIAYLGWGTYTLINDLPPPSSAYLILTLCVGIVHCEWVLWRQK